MRPSGRQPSARRSGWGRSWASRRWRRRTWQRPPNPRFRHNQRALFAGPLKLIAEESGARQLFDLEADPEEARDLFGDPRGAELERRLDAWLGGCPAGAGTPAGLGAGTRARLEALGYGR